MLKACILTSQALLATQTITLPDGRQIIEHVTILEPCKMDDRQPSMNSIFFEKAWKRIDNVRAWSKLG